MCTWFEAFSISLGVLRAGSYEHLLEGGYFSVLGYLRASVLGLVRALALGVLRAGSP